MTPLFCPVLQCLFLFSHEGLYSSPPEEFSNSALPSLLSWSFIFISCLDLMLFLELLHYSPYSNPCFQPHLPLRLRIRRPPEWLTLCFPSHIPSLKQSATIPLCSSKSWVPSLRAESFRHLRDTWPLPSSFPLFYWSVYLSLQWKIWHLLIFPIKTSYSLFSPICWVSVDFCTSFKSYFRDIFGTVFLTYFLTLYRLPLGAST